MTMLADRCGRPPPSLLPPERRIQCEAWKLVYADFLLRIELLGPRVELLQYTFIEGEPGFSARAAAGDVPLFTCDTILTASSGGHPELGVGEYGLTLRSDQALSVQVCAGCTSGLKVCPACNKPPIKPLCSYCRLPIKGES
jgi:hypothetical protein